VTVAGWSRLDAFGSEFWDKKPPSEWTSEEIAKLTTKSPWAKEVSAQVPREGGGGGRGGMGGGGMSGGAGGGMRPIQGTVRWESAQTILDAVKTPLPEAFANHYVISVSGFPLGGRRQDDDSGENSRSRDEMLDKLKAYTSLQPKGKAIAQPGVVQAQASSGPGSILFGFARDMLELSADDKEVLFSTQIGRAMVKTKFEMKDMKYHGKLAV
jgi:hypothetical protein